MPFFSVVIPLYNKEKYIKETLNSVLAQTFQDFEIIIVNDGSTDKSLSIVEAFQNKKITVYSNKNHGLSFTRNFGIKKAKAQYVAFLDADDLWAEDFLETSFNVINKHPNNNVFTSKEKPFRNVKDISLVKSNEPIEEIVISDFDTHSKFLVGFSSFVANKNTFNDIGFFNETVNYGEEYDFFIRCFSKYPLVYINNYKAFYRFGTDSQLTAPNKNFKRIIPDYEIYFKSNHKPGLKKYLNRIHYLLMVLYKAERNKEKARFYKKKVNISNLNFVQKIKYYLPIWVFYYSKRIYIWISKFPF
ncbi:glycosyltransferase family 2 protein [Tamlana crocina]|uniref:Glycosyltransferase family 2 protein n=1 Tax=Tamlana crocina TaxID=393006 RepID=A0ABX1DCC5_9FLAO|nr:glycosyltransferase family A protein [Tamlana crocina]NJX14688.1 glycosyltransferase family 2 protein [Tamlana crocina]